MDRVSSGSHIYRFAEHCLEGLCGRIAIKVSIDSYTLFLYNILFFLSFLFRNHDVSTFYVSGDSGGANDII